ncbi:MAG: CdvA-like protein [Candidatus Bathyarchaeia archaeon]
MSQPTSNLFLFIGKPVKDEYGRSIGRIVSFAVNPTGRVTSVFMKHEDGEFRKYSSEQFRIDGENIVLLPSIKLRVKALCDEIPLLWRKEQALNGLLEKKKVPSELYNELQKTFDGALNQLKTDAQTTLENIDKYIARCNAQIRQLNSALIHLEIEREIGRIDENSYQTAIEMIQDGLKWAHAEREDLEALKNQLSNMLLGETPPISPQHEESTTETSETNETQKTEEATSPSLPEPPVVVHVKGEN